MTLREKIEEQVQWAINMPDDFYDGYLADDAAGRILDAVAEALTSEAAVDATRRRIMGEAGTDLLREETRFTITAALTATGIVKGEGE